MEANEQMKRLLQLTEDNNVMLKKIRSVQKTQAIMRGLYYVFLIGSAFGAYYFVQPYLGSLINLYTGGGSSILNGETNTATKPALNLDAGQLQDLIKQLQK